MEPHIRARFTPEVSAAVAQVVGVDPALGKNLGFESFVHRVQRDGQTVFVKSTWSGRRTPEQIHAELDFVRHLADGGAAVARPLPLADSSYLASVPAEDGAFHVSVCAEAPGDRVEKGAVTDAHLVAWGRLLGQTHRLATDPVCVPWANARATWTDEYEPLRPFAKDARVRERYATLMDRLAALPTTPDVFGLVHTDPHDANVHFEGTEPTMFDFEDCMAFWYASDIAIVLYYTLNRHVEAEARQEAYPRFLAQLRQGYDPEYALPDAAWEALPLFLDFRETMLWLVCERSIPHDERGEAFTAWMDGMFARIVGGEHALSLRV